MARERVVAAPAIAARAVHRSSRRATSNRISRRHSSVWTGNPFVPVDHAWGISRQLPDDPVRRSPTAPRVMTRRRPLPKAWPLFHRPRYGTYGAPCGGPRPLRDAPALRRRPLRPAFGAYGSPSHRTTRTTSYCSRPEPLPHPGHPRMTTLPSFSIPVPKAAPCARGPSSTAIPAAPALVSQTP